MATLRLCVLVAAVAAAAVALPADQEFGYAFVVPSETQANAQEWNALLERRPDGYRWGFEAPDQVRYETKDGDVVKGSYAFQDANGEPVVAVYNSKPGQGYHVVFAKGNQVPGNTAVEEAAAEPETYAAPAVDAAVEQTQSVRLVSPLSPLLYPLLSGAPQGQLFYSAPNPFIPGGALVYSVPESQLPAAASVSQVAAQFDATPVAAVHDARAPPRFYSSNVQTGPVLLHREVDGGVQYNVLVPTQ